MDKQSTSAARTQKLNQLKTSQNLDGILALDNRGFSYHNDGFPKKNYQVHSLYQLSRFFYPENSQNTVVTVQGMETLTNIQKINNEDIIACRIKKENK